MAIYFFDSSAIVKRYVNETGSQWVADVMNPQAGNRIYIASIAAVEVTASIARRGRQGTLSANEVQQTLQQLRMDLQSRFRQVALSSQTIQTSMNLAETYFLRGYDAVQLASAMLIQAECTALQLPPLIFVSADIELNTVAASEGLLVEDPNANP